MSLNDKFLNSLGIQNHIKNIRIGWFLIRNYNNKLKKESNKLTMKFKFTKKENFTILRRNYLNWWCVCELSYSK